MAEEKGIISLTPQPTSASIDAVDSVNGESAGAPGDEPEVLTPIILNDRREFVREPQFLVAMAVVLSDGLSHQEIHGRWVSLHEGEKQSILAVCEWLLMHWEILERARAEHITLCREEAPPQ
jgi:hypothetical protein